MLFLYKKPQLIVSYEFFFIVCRKLLEVRPDLKVPILWPIPQNTTNFVSECLSLINEDYTENSSEDEEYKPDDDEVCGRSWYPTSIFTITNPVFVNYNF